MKPRLLVQFLTVGCIPKRSLRTLKYYVRNKARPHGSIAEGYLMNESSSFCSPCLSEIETRLTKDDRNNDSIPEHEVIMSSKCLFRRYKHWERPIFEAYQKKRNDSFIGTSYFWCNSGVPQVLISTLIMMSLCYCRHLNSKLCTSRNT